MIIGHRIDANFVLLVNNYFLIGWLGSKTLIVLGGVQTELYLLLNDNEPFLCFTVWRDKGSRARFDRFPLAANAFVIQNLS